MEAMPCTPAYAGAVHLRSNEVHSWCVSLDVSPEACARLDATLTRDERSRSARFRFERDRRRFIVAHGVLREILGRYLGAHPGELRFMYKELGKPELSHAFGDWLRFSLSHSGDLALIAVAARADVGVDLEYVRLQPDHAEIAERFFSPDEVDHLKRLPAHLQAEAFFSLWTKKEAYLKACGEGLASLDGGSPEPAPARDWSLHTVEPAPGYIGALAIEGRGWRLTQRKWRMD